MNNETLPKIRERKNKVNGRLYTYWIVDPGVIDGNGSRASPGLGGVWCAHVDRLFKS